MTKRKNLILCAAGDEWMNAVVCGLSDVGITSDPCKVPEQLWETPAECSAILISLEEINSLYQWLHIKDLYEQEQSPDQIDNNMNIEIKDITEIHEMIPIKDAVKELCRIQDSPVIIVVSGQEDGEELMCLQAGAAECVSMSQSVPLAVERIRRQMTKNDEEKGDILHWNCVILDRGKKQLHVGKCTCDLSGREFKVLSALIQAQGAVVSRSRLATLLWGRDGDKQHRNLDVVLSSLRSHLKGMGLEIVTRYGEGYYLREGTENN